jgi:radical SAM superfamily enzyme YgiQ (UPF0313 family)
MPEMEQEVLNCLPAFYSTRRIFLTDGDALIAPQQDLLALLTLLQAHFPFLQRIGMYANTGSILGKSVEELVHLHKLGLDIVYLGIESGDDNLLAWMRKGVTIKEIREASRRVKEANIKLSVTVMLGIGGYEWSLQHARATGKLLSEIGPDHVGALTTIVVPGTPLHKLELAGDFRLPDSFTILNELAEMLEYTEMRGLFFANHASNYLPLRIRMPMQRAEAIVMLHQFVVKQDASILRPDWMRRL